MLALLSLSPGRTTAVVTHVSTPFFALLTKESLIRCVADRKTKMPQEHPIAAKRGMPVACWRILLLCVYGKIDMLARLPMPQYTASVFIALH